MKFDVMDVRYMTYPSEHFDLVLDKGTLDAMLCSKHTGYYDAALMLKECQRVLKTDGYYVATVGERWNWEVAKKYVKNQGNVDETQGEAKHYEDDDQGVRLVAEHRQRETQHDHKNQC